MLLLAAVLFVGWILMWVMLSTRTYSSSWAPKLAMLTDGAKFGKQGPRIMIFVLPVVILYVVACVYLHLLKGGDPDAQSRKRRVFSTGMAAWRRPVLVGGPLGIVTGIELAFLLMFLALLVWCYYAFISLEFSKIRVKPGEKLWQAEMQKAGMRLGTVGSLCCVLLFFPVARGSPLLPLVDLSSESSIKYHVWLGHIVMVLFTAHGLCYILVWASTDQLHSMLTWARTRVSIVPGELALLSGLAMWATALPRIRRRMFELFYYAHHLYIPFVVFFALHVGVTTFCYVLPGVFLFMVDRCLRCLQSRNRVRLVSARILPSQDVELNFSKIPSLRFEPTSTLFVNVPCVSRLQWHPFTVTSSGRFEPDRLSVVIGRRGDWTQKLYKTVSSLPPSFDGRLDVSVEGPYSPATSTGFLGNEHDSLVMVSGGIGITPFISIIRELAYIHISGTAPDEASAKTPSILLVCVFKTSAELAMLELLVPDSGGISGLDLRIEAFVTRERADDEPPCQEVRFKPCLWDAPVASVLGPNSSWLWHAVLVAASFAVFLALTAVLERFYVYPVNGDEEHAYPWAARTMLSLLFLCVSIAGVAGAAFLWSKRSSGKEAKAAQSVDGATPGMSPAPLLRGRGTGGMDRELESLPTRSLEQVTNVHFGHRPDLKRMLLGIDGHNVGVLASGPPRMVEDIAAICSSGLRSNLHFQSLSFTW